jgi:transposase InsO family protein
MPFETIALNFITKLPVSQGYNSILMVTDHDCTKAAVFIPCNEEISGEETAALYVKHIFTQYGLPLKIISDCDPRFTSKFTRELCRTLGITQKISTAYHPRTDGQSEHSNQWLKQYLRFWVNKQQDDWAQLLPMAEFAHNNWKCETMRESPFFTLMGYHPHADWTDKTSPIPQVMRQVDQLKEARDKAQELMMQAQQSWIKHKDTPRYQVGDQVWLEGHHLRTNQPIVKLTPRRHRPFKVTQVMSPVNYRLQLPMQWSIHNVFHTDLLTPYHETMTHGANYQCLPPDLINGVEEYKVEKVLDS